MMMHMKSARMNWKKRLNRAWTAAVSEVTMSVVGVKDKTPTFLESIGPQFFVKRRQNKNLHFSRIQSYHKASKKRISERQNHHFCLSRMN